MMEKLIAEQWIKGSTADPRWIGQNKHGIIFTTLGGNDESNAQRLVKCWNEYDKEVERANLAEAALVKFEQLAAEELAGFNALQKKADVCDEVVEALKRYGRHSADCMLTKEAELNRINAMSTTEVYCDCGFEQALAKAKV